MKVVAGMLLGGVVWCTFACTAAFAEPILSIQPLEAIVSPGSAFSLSADIQDVMDLYAFQFDLTFAPEVLVATVALEGPFLASAGRSTFFFPGRLGGGTITSVADTLLGPGPGASGSGALVTVVLTALGKGTTTVAFSNVLLLDSSLHEIASTKLPAAITLTPEPPVFMLTALAILGIAAAYRFSRRVLPFLLLFSALIAPARAAAPGYKFSIVVQTGDTIGGKTLVFLGYNPKINNAGTVVFEAGFNNGGGGAGIFTPSKQLVGTGDIIDGNLLGGFSYPAVNDAGTVVFNATFGSIAPPARSGNGIFTLSHLLAGSGDVIGGKTISFVNIPRINNSGMVVFDASSSPDEGDIFTPSQLLAAPGDTIGGKMLYGAGGPLINDSGTVVFSASLFPISSGEIGTGLFTPSELLVGPGDRIGGETLVYPAETYAINNAGSLVFGASFLKKTSIPGQYGNGLFSTSELLVQAGDVIDSKRLTGIQTVAMNNAGMVVFVGTFPNAYGGSESGIFTASELLIAGGDTIDSKTLPSGPLFYVTSIAINDAGTMVFRVPLSETSQAIIMADRKSVV